MFVEQDLEQGSDAWKRWRYKGIGGTAACTIQRVNAYDTPWQLAREYWGLRPPPEKNYAMTRGLDLEPIARRIFSRQWKVGASYAPTVQHEEYPFMFASCDMLSVARDPLTGQPEWGGEIKNPMPTENNWDVHQQITGHWMPEKYYPQVQHCMFVTGAKKWYFINCFENKAEKEYDVRASIIYPDPDYVREMIINQYDWYRLMMSGRLLLTNYGHDEDVMAAIEYHIRLRFPSKG